MKFAKSAKINEISKTSQNQRNLVKLVKSVELAKSETLWSPAERTSPKHLRPGSQT